ncbi:MAG: hypothetical protein JW719_03430 [Pirellulales bacterium]|nr:hypothetical protein [Pirellulales bacterium]
MKHSSTSFAALSAGVIALLALFWTVYGMLTYLIFGFSSIDPKLGAMLAATAGTIVASIGLIVVSRWLERHAAAKQELREKQTAIYEQLLQFLFRTITSQSTGEPMPEADVLRFMSNYAQRMMIWGSDDVLAAWSRLRTALGEGSPGTNRRQIMLAYEELIRTVRRDLGHATAGLESGKLLRLFLNEPPATE